MKNRIILLVAMLVSLSVFAQEAPLIYKVTFRDKHQSDFSVNRPEEFLSRRALERRQRYDVPVTDDDLPISPSYIRSLENSGARILARSRWLNMVIVELESNQDSDQISRMQFVERMEEASTITAIKKNGKPFFMVEQTDIPFFKPSPKNTSTAVSFDYGPSLNQVDMINGLPLHHDGYTGKGIIIAVLDAGFRAADTMAVFDSLWMQNRMLGTKDFVNPGGDIFEPSIHAHGTMVLSIMAGNLPGQLVGTAPDAGYYLIRTEDGTAEYKLEEYYWMMGAEYADSLGADIINSSLGYTEFDDPADNHTYQDMDGNTTPVTIGADKAAERGILVCNSAGNSGNSPWKYIGAPADGDSVLSVGAVDPLGRWATFSSLGPSSDGRTKPDIAAQGQQTIIATPWGGVTAGNGTSFSSPVIAGMTACLWQAKRSFTNMQIISAIMKSSRQYNTPDDTLGYGIPDYSLAKSLLDTTDVEMGTLQIYPNPFSQSIEFWINLPDHQKVKVFIFDITGKQIFFREIELFKGISQVTLENPVRVSGLYILKVQTQNESLVGKIIHTQ
ncbi:MAG TPA: S8 family serine peptidase [Bacteroidales bacterium]|nr:S8 family serine peptidase [Bacteroidales bacterium]